MIGYKAFNSDGTNRYGKEFKVGRKYHIDGEIVARFGSEGNGYYYCTHIADVFRFFPYDEDVKVGVINASGIIDHVYDDYNDYEIYACSDMRLVNYLTRNEVLQLIILDGSYSISKAIKTYKLTDEEKDIVLNNVRGDFSLIEEVLWYCFDKKDIYSLEREDLYKTINEEYSKLDERLNNIKKKTKK